MVTLSLPQWSFLASIPLSYAGVEMIEEGVGEVGLPVWGAPFISFPLVHLPLALNSLVTAAIVAIPLAAALFTGLGRRMARWLLPGAVVGALAYAFFSFPNGVVARDYLISFGVLFILLIASAVIGIMWRWRVWLLCAAIFYAIWTMLYTSVFSLFTQAHGFCPGAPEVGGAFNTLCAKLGGVYTGSWQGLGYWWLQHDVARGGQPWYYHFVIGSTYEFLPLIFGAVAIVYYLRKGELLGLLLAFWAVLTLGAYTYAGEKMPWLLVNVAVPFIFLAGKFIGDIIDRVPWQRVLRGAPSALLILAPLLLLAGVYLLHRYLDQGEMDSWQIWGILGAIIVTAAASVFLIRRARPRLGDDIGGSGGGSAAAGVQLLCRLPS